MNTTDFLPGPSKSHSSPAVRFDPDSESSKSKMARRRKAELAGTTFRGVTGCTHNTPCFCDCSVTHELELLQPSTEASLAAVL